jgi:hypothetical protein
VEEIENSTAWFVVAAVSVEGGADAAGVVFEITP